MYCIWHSFFIFTKKKHKLFVMKKIIIFLPALILITYTACQQNSSKQTSKESINTQAATSKAETASSNENTIKPSAIKTNYFDLPSEHKETFNKTLNIKNNKLTESSIESFKAYINKNLLAESNPVSSGITSNYFWYVYNALPGFVAEDERHNGYYSEENALSFEEQLKAYGIYRIDRSSENLKTLFEFGKPIMKKFVNPEKYNSLGMSQKVNSLIKIYDILSETDDFKQRLTEAYNHADTATGVWLDYGEEPVFETYNAAYGLDAYALSEIICQYFEYDRYHPYYGHPDLSFWMRRVHENNTETVYELLQNIQSIYK